MARTRNQGSKWIRAAKRLAIYLRDGLACCFCGATVEDAAVLTLDHLLARELGGSNDATNLVTCCLSCNSSKQDLSMRDWFRALRDRGIDTSKLGAKIRRLTSRDLKAHKAAAKAIMTERGCDSAAAAIA